MPSDALELLRDAVAPAAEDWVVNHTHDALPDALRRLSLPDEPPVTEGEQPRTKRQRFASAWQRVTDDDLPSIASALLPVFTGGERQRNLLQDALWATEHHPVIDRRARREICAELRDLPMWVDADGLRRLVRSLWVTNPDFTMLLSSLSVGSAPGVLEGIEQHVIRNGDWGPDELFRQVGAFDCSDRRFAVWIEGLISPEVRPDLEAQRAFAAAVNRALGRVNLEMRQVGETQGYPSFKLVTLSDRTKGAPKNIIFATLSKPDLRFGDALDNDIEICSDAADVLAYDRPLDLTRGLTWQELQDWWQDEFGASEEPKRSLYQRLLRCLPSDSPPQQQFFRQFHRVFASRIRTLPALLPEVWLLWDPKTADRRGKDALLNQRMDFVMLLPRGRRAVLEIDGSSHYTDSGRASASRYARTMRGDRKLRLAGYEVFRFGAAELDTPESAAATVADFFTDLLGVECDGDQVAPSDSSGTG